MTDKIQQKYRLDFYKKVFKKTAIPIIDIKIFDQYFSFILDTGASHSHIDKHFYNYILSTYGDPPKGDNMNSVAVGSEQKDSPTVLLPLTIEEEIIDTMFIVSDLENVVEYTKEKTGLDIEGLLGATFFEFFKWKIDFEKLIVWK